MESIKTATRIHPLMAAAAVSVVIVSLAGTAAITGLLPNSRATVAPAPSALPLATQLSAVAPAPAPMLMAAADIDRIIGRVESNGTLIAPAISYQETK